MRRDNDRQGPTSCGRHDCSLVSDEPGNRVVRKYCGRVCNEMPVAKVSYLERQPLLRLHPEQALVAFTYDRKHSVAVPWWKQRLMVKANRLVYRARHGAQRLDHPR